MAKEQGEQHAGVAKRGDQPGSRGSSISISRRIFDHIHSLAFAFVAHNLIWIELHGAHGAKRLHSDSPHTTLRSVTGYKPRMPCTHDEGTEATLGASTRVLRHLHVG